MRVFVRIPPDLFDLLATTIVFIVGCVAGGYLFHVGWSLR